MLDEKFLNTLSVVDWGYTDQLEAVSYSHFKEWSESHRSGILDYLKGERADKRHSLSSYYPECQSALVFLFDYSKARVALKKKKYIRQIASYVLGFKGFDYHFILKDSLQQIAQHHQIDHFKISLDTQPVLERDLAYRAGLGWFGKNSMLINRKKGSYFIIGSLLLNRKLPLEKRKNDVDHCGTCRACLDACPTSAIEEDTRTLIADQCISTYTIELFKDAEPPRGYEKSDWIFGCDICQDVCPWNDKVLLNQSPELSPSLIEDYFLKQNDFSELEKMSKREFRKKFKSTPLERTGRDGLLKNLKRGNSS